MQIDFFKSMKLIGGAGGLNNEITTVGTLDSEFTRKYASHFFEESIWNPGEFVLTQFLYAQNNEDLMLSSVKRMHKLGTCGLAIKNVLKLAIDKEIIRYANRNNYPVFIFMDNNIFFEDIIVLINKCIERARHYVLSEKLVDQIIYGEGDKTSIKKLVMEINCYSTNFYEIYYLLPKAESSMKELLVLLKSGIRKELFDTGNAVAKFKDGVFLICSIRENEPPRNMLEHLKHIEAHFNVDINHFHIGISQRQYSLNSLRTALQQGFFAALHANLYQRHISLFENIGAYKLLFLNIEESWTKNYMNHILQPIVDYDAKNNSSLFDTLLLLEQHNGNVKVVSDNLLIHENTIRYRIKKVYEVLGTDSNNRNAEIELYMAIKLYRIKKMLKIDLELFE